MFNGKRLSGWMALAVFATVGGAMVAADPAFAKVDVDKLTIGGEARVRYEIRTGGDFGTTQANISGASHRIRVGVGYDLTPDVSFFAQFQDARIYGQEAASATATGIVTVSGQNANGTGVDLHQGYIQVKNVLVPGLSLKIGRQEIIFGDHRLFGNFGWSQIGNAFDGVRATHSAGQADLDLFWVRVQDFGETGLAGAPGVQFPTGGTRSTTDQDIFGAYLTIKAVKNWTIEPYYFLLNDRRLHGSIARSTAQAPNQTRSTVGGRINGKAGGLDFTGEVAHQFGATASVSTLGAGATAQQRDLHINAHAEAVKLGYTFEAVPMKPRIGFEFDYASGDPCNGTATCDGLTGNPHANTFDNLFPTNHFHYGYMDLMSWRNMVNYQGMFDVKPSPVSKLQFNFIIHRLARTGDNWYRASQGVYAVPVAGNQAASLGQELDVHYWHTFKEKFKFEIGYGHFFAGEFIEKSGAQVTNGSSTGPVSTGTFTNVSDQNWGYVMTSILF